jgi:hypothetical protein
MDMFVYHQKISINYSKNKEINEGLVLGGQGIRSNSKARARGVKSYLYSLMLQDVHNKALG